MHSTLKRIGHAIWLAFSESDERYLDLVRLGYFLGVITFLTLAIISVVRGDPFGPIEYGTGLAAILFGGGAGIGARAKLEDGSGKKAIKNPDIPNPVGNPDRPTHNAVNPLQEQAPPTVSTPPTGPPMEQEPPK